MTPADRTALLRQAQQALRQQDHVAAAAIGRRLVVANANDPGGLDVLAQIAMDTGDLEGADDLLRRAVRAAPKNADLRVRLGRLFARRGRHRDAVTHYDAALKLAPGHVGALAAKGIAYERLDKYDRARRVLRPHVTTDGPHPAIAAVYLRVLLHDGETEEAVALGERVVGAAPPPSRHVRDVWFALAKARERLGRHDEAFDAAEQANAIQAPPFDRGQAAALVDRMIETFAAARLVNLPRATYRDETPVLIVGMPRSGSTLVERIIAAHPAATGVGEHAALHRVAYGLPGAIGSKLAYPECVRDATPAQLDEQGKAYLQMLRVDAPKGERIVDKNLGNATHLGLVELMLPGARMIHTRRDPLDCCLSCYFERLTPAGAPYAFDLGDLGFQYRQHERLMAHWRETLRVPILDVEYERVTEDPESAIRAIIDFCGLPWDDTCLRFHESRRRDGTLSYDQVRRPIYKSSVGRAAAFGARLDPLRAALDESSAS